jgi:hypothetical protein
VLRAGGSPTSAPQRKPGDLMAIDNVIPNATMCFCTAAHASWHHGGLEADHFVRSFGAARARGRTVAGDADKQSRTDAHPLDGMRKLSPRQLQALKSSWLTTIEALVGAAATEEGRAGLREVLDLTPDALDKLLQEAANALGEERFRDLMKPKPGGPTGALWDEKCRRAGGLDEGGQGS